MKVSIIAAVGKNRGIGKDGKLLWRLSDDLKRFKALTKGHAVIMGRKTWDSIGRPLPDRKNIVISRNPDFKAEGAIAVPSFEAALKEAAGDMEVFVIGGGEIYKLALPMARTLYLTEVDADLPADAFFPELDPTEWMSVSHEEHEPDEKHPYRFEFKVFEHRERQLSKH